MLHSFLVGDDGRVYEGVGWGVQGMHTQGYNNISLGFAFFGTKEGNGHPSCPSPKSSLLLSQHSGVFSSFSYFLDDPLSPGLLLPLTSVAGHAGCPPPGLVFFSGGGPLPLASHREVSSLLSAALFSSCSCPGRIWASALTSVSMTVTPSSLTLTLL